jgi:hypothetical protein
MCTPLIAAPLVEIETAIDWFEEENATDMLPDIPP